MKAGTRLSDVSDELGSEDLLLSDVLSTEDTRTLQRTLICLRQEGIDHFAVTGGPPSHGTEGSPKNARDFCSLIEHGADQEVQSAWTDHRKRIHPVTFADARARISALLFMYPELLIDGGHPYEAVPCLSCRDHETFDLASMDQIERVRMLRP